MKKDFIQGTVKICVLLSIMLISTMLSDIRVLAADSRYTPVNASCDTYSTQFLYNDNMLLQDARELSTDIAKASVGLAVAAYNAKKTNNITDALSEMEYSSIIQEGYGRTETINDNDYVAYTIATREIADANGEKYIVYCVPIKGTSKDAEWFSNFNLGTTGDHKGFYLAEKEIIDNLISLTKSDGYDKTHRIIWTTGHSRGAAVANILAGELTENYSKWHVDALNIASPEHIFGYTFACPNVSKRAVSSYTNIYNYNNPGDIVPVLPLEEWNYCRYGQTIDHMDDLSNISQRFISEHKGATSFDSLQSTSRYEGFLSTIVVNEVDFHSDDNRLIFLIGAYALGGSEDASFVDLLTYAGVDEKSWIVKQLVAAGLDAVAPGANTALSKVKSISNDVETCKEIFDSGILTETEGMTDDEFTQWVSEHREDVNKIESVYKLNIETRADLVAAMAVSSEGEATVVQVAQAVAKATELFQITDGDVVGAIDHGHTQATYGCWINSMYYGYKGWYGNDIIEEINLPDFVDYLDGEVFGWCSKLRSVTIPERIEYIGNNAFKYCGIEELTIESNQTELYYEAFNHCDGLMKVTIPVDYSYPYANASPFLGCNNVEEIYYTKGTTGIMPDIVNADYNTQENDNYIYRLEYSAKDSLKKVTFEEGVTRIGANAYGWFCNNENYTGHANLEEINLPSTLKEIGEGAFYRQETLKGIEIPDSVTTIGRYAFARCLSLEKVSDVKFPSGIESIPDYCFYKCTGLKEIDLPATVRTIGRSAFSYCIEVEEVVIPSAVIELGYDAYGNCSGLKKVTIPVDYSYPYANASPFLGCNNVEEIYYTKGTTGIMPDIVNADYNTQENDNYIYRLEYSAKDSLKKVTFEDGVTRIGANVYGWFYNGNHPQHTNLEEINLPSTLKEIGEGAFYQQETLRSIEIPDSVTTIGKYAFAKCTNMTEVIIPSVATSIGTNGFLSGESITIYSVKNSKAELFAKENNNSFIALNYPYIEAENFDMDAGTEQQFTATVYISVADATEDVEWYVSGNDNEQTIIDDTGHLFIARGETAATIIVSATYGKTANSVQISVTPYQKGSQEFEEIADIVKTYGDEPFELGATLKSGDGSLSYSSDNEKVVSIDENGLITIVGAGNAKLTATAAETEDYKEASCTVTVSVGKATREVVASISRNELLVGETAEITADASALFRSNNEEIATVDEQGIVKAISLGDTEIEVVLAETDNEFEAKTILPISVVEEIHEHSLEEIHTVPATCDEEGAEACWKCSGCGQIFADKDGTTEIGAPYTVPALGHDWGEWEDAGESVCAQSGLKVRICKRDASHKEYNDSALMNHQLKKTEEITPTCDSDGNITYFTCDVCGKIFADEDGSKEISAEDTILSAIGHSYGEWMTAKAATCAEAGLKERSCINCEDKQTEEIPAAGHSWNKDYTVDQPATCQAEGSQSIHCSVCDVVKEDSSQVISKADHEYGEWSIVKVATTEVAGLKERVCSVCGNKETAEIPKKETPVAEPTPTQKPTQYRFSDVQDPNHAYYKAIYVAADAGITKGYSDGTFGINRSCTRGEMMMFLWRYAGKPAPKNVSKSPFKDVPKTNAFYKAIIWGSQKGITKGYPNGTFGIDRNVTRGECMMFLWRLKGKPVPKVVAKAPFPDVPKSHVFYNAVLWGYQKKITTGFTTGKLKGKFGVNENCSRGQIVTFLYRAK